MSNSPDDQARMQAPNVINTWGSAAAVPNRPLRTWFDVTFGPPKLDVPKVPFYPEGENVPRLGEILVEANKHLMPSQYMPDTYDSLKAKAQKAAQGS